MKTKKIITSREIGLIIKKRRKELGISPGRTCGNIIVSYQQVQRYENDGRQALKYFRKIEDRSSKQTVIQCCPPCSKVKIKSTPCVDRT